MGGIFISYRRDDSAAFAGPIFDRLKKEFGHEAVFLDVDAIPAGADFIGIIQRNIEPCDVLLALIGPRWITSDLTNGRSRLHDPTDIVRVEIETALRRGIPIVPILLEGARMPRREQLPTEIEALSHWQSCDVSHAFFHINMDRLVRALRGLRGRGERKV
jgi:hypothetical protein